MSKIFLEVNGINYEGFTDIAINDSIEAFSSSFSFSATIRETALGRVLNEIKLGDNVKVYIDDILKITGFIEDVDKEISTDNHTITYSGRDIGGDISDSSINQKSYSQRNFELLTNLVLKDNGFSIKVINEVGLLKLEASETIKTEQGETIFDFLDRYAKKLQILLKMDNKGNLKLIREDNTIVRNMLINNYTSDTNILSSKLKLSTIDRFNVIEVYSQSDNKTHTITGISQKGRAIDPQIRKTRKRIATMETSTQNKTLNSLAQWSVNLRRAKGSRYTCKVVGFYSSSKTIWQPNTLVDIIDYAMEVQGTFLIQGVQFSQNLQGSFTTLDIVEQGAFNPTAINNLSNSFAKGLIN